MHHRAIAVSFAYLALSFAYVAGSTQIAAAFTPSVDAFAMIETGKGLLFVVLSGLGLFGLVELLERRQDEGARERDRMRGALILAERRAEAGLQVGVVAHDLRNVLTGMTLGLEVLRDQQVDPAVLEVVVEATQRGIALSQRLARMGDTVRRLGDCGCVEVVDLPLLLCGYARDLASHPDLVGRALEVRVEGAPAPLRACPTSLHQIVSNLVLNAAAAAGPGGRIEIRLIAAEAGVVLEVHDDGPGVPLADRARCLEPFYTTRAEGTGLGLVSVAQAAALHGGEVTIGDSPLGGACFRVTLRP